MRLALIIIVALLVSAPVVYGQADYIGLYNDVDYQSCSVQDGPGLHQIYVVHKTTTGAFGSSFMVDNASAWAWISDTGSHLYIGNSLGGVSVSYGGPCLSPEILVMTINYLSSGGGTGSCAYLEVVANPGATTGKIEVVDCGNNLVAGNGGRFYINPTIACPCEPTDPWITTVEDVGNDQGRQVRVSWGAALFDAPGDLVDITGYALYRRQDAIAASSGANLSDIGETRGDAPAMAGWDYVGSHPARGDAFYQMVVPSLCDSTASSGICWSTYLVSALTPDPLVYYDSDPDSGYSVDNIAPGVPGNFTIAYNSGSGNHLTWLESDDADFQVFRIYRGNSPDFTPSSANLIHSTAEAGWYDPEFDGWNVHYKVSAEDFNGNEGDAAGPSTVTGVGDGAEPARYALHQNTPNPFNPSTLIPYDVPDAAIRTTLRIYDVDGRLVRTLVDAVESPGRKVVQWNGLGDDGSPAPSGVYFARLRAGGFVDHRKLVLLK